eukprot:1573102-Alexandrium_andersonii.AAC.1
MLWSAAATASRLKLTLGWILRRALKSPALATIAVLLSRPSVTFGFSLYLPNDFGDLARATIEARPSLFGRHNLASANVAAEVDRGSGATRVAIATDWMDE